MGEPTVIYGYYGRPATLTTIQEATGPGWADLVKRCFDVCVKHGIEVHQVKEKFGGLRFYVGGVPSAVADEVYDTIDDAEAESLRTCESCGKSGEPRGGGWIKTLCDECHNTRKDRVYDAALKERE